MRHRVGVGLGHAERQLLAGLVLLDVRLPATHVGAGLGLCRRCPGTVAVHGDAGLARGGLHLRRFGRQLRLPAIPLQLLRRHLGLELCHLGARALGLGAHLGAVCLGQRAVGLHLGGLGAHLCFVEVGLGRLGVHRGHEGAHLFGAGLDARALQLNQGLGSTHPGLINLHGRHAPVDLGLVTCHQRLVDLGLDLLGLQHGLEHLDLVQFGLDHRLIGTGVAAIAVQQRLEVLQGGVVGRDGVVGRFLRCRERQHLQFVAVLQQRALQPQRLLDAVLQVRLLQLGLLDGDVARQAR